MSVLVLGTIALDTVKTPSGARKNMLGGSAAHFSLACRLFTDVCAASVIGRDFPRRYVDFLEKKGVNLKSLIVSEDKTFRWEGEYAKDIDCALTLNTELGALLTFKPCIHKEQRKIKHIFLANIDPDLQSHLLAQAPLARLAALDSMNYWIKHKRLSLLKILKKIDIYLANEEEARQLTGENNLLKAAKGLRKFGPKMILIKKGGDGAFMRGNDFIFFLPAYPVETVIDPTGAGDTFAGAFMGYLARAKQLNEETFKKALLYGTVAASFNVEGFGVERTASLTKGDLDKRLFEFRRCLC